MSEPVGVLIIDKPVGITSHGVVARVRKALGIRKVGHAGTLDPDATGVLVVGVGPATRLLGYLAASDKEYTSTFVLGQSTLTDDAAGDTIAWADAHELTRDEIEHAMLALTGAIEQRPSSVSAIKVSGKRAYDLVRSGEDVELATRPVTVSAFDLLDVCAEERQGHRVMVAKVRVDCSAGTYVRALARDLGQALGVGGHVATLRRTRSGAFTLDDAVALDDVSTSSRLLRPAEAARRTLPTVAISSDAGRLARHGVQLPWPADAGAGPVAFLDGDDLVGVAQERSGRTAWSVVFA
ncbi:MAG: tRNA pseudouridine(55) synthase TruB [Actinomycetales bacterium mxb001]|nr:MAG: tRNA pseudouridine(55) synthase TruB [Actinomycetales bacterium mxb001]